MNQDLNILHISAHHVWRGGEQQLAYLYEELLNYPSQQWLFCAENKGMHKYCQEKNIPVLQFKASRIWLFPNALKLKKICTDNKIDLIHVHDSHAHTLAFISYLFGNKSKIIVSRRVDFPVKNSFLSKWKYNNQGVKKYICVSEKVKEILAKNIYDKSKLSCVHSGIDLTRFKAGNNTAKIRLTYDIDPSLLLIGNVASIAPHKDYFTFVDTAEIILKNGLKAFFLIIGDGPEAARIKDYIRKKRLEQYFIITGFRNDIPELLPELDIFLFTSKTEGLGTSLLDALASGTPIVSTTAGGITEMLSHNENALLADVGDAKTLATHVMKLIKDEELQEKLIRNGAEQLKQFTKEEMARKTFLIYKEVT